MSTVTGALVPSNFTGDGGTAFSNAFGSGASITPVSTGGAYNVTGPTAITASSIGVTVSGASAIAFAGDNDTLTAGGTTPYIAFLGNGSVLVQGAGPSTVYGGSGAATVDAGTGSTTIDGGSGSLYFSAGASSNDSLTAGSGSTSLVGGSGGSDTFVGATGVSGTDSSMAVTLTGGSTGDNVTGGSGNTTVDASATTGPLQITTNPLDNSGTLNATLGSGADSVIAGSGDAYITAGSGADVFGFVSGHGGGSVTISGFNAKDNLAFGDLTIKSEQFTPTTGTTGPGTDVMLLSDGTTVTFLDVDGKISP
jgi:Ca2+-binding RTX toxin-like protein